MNIADTEESNLALTRQLEQQPAPKPPAEPVVLCSCGWSYERVRGWLFGYWRCLNPDCRQTYSNRRVKRHLAEIARMK